MFLHLLVKQRRLILNQERRRLIRIVAQRYAAQNIDNQKGEEKMRKELQRFLERRDKERKSRTSNEARIAGFLT
ncbi:hypothetical protein GYMLUDRAFT_47312, partial [Collybiopsis luxurians FD-317 M1]